MKYFLLRRQREQGCDYTIGCGMTFHQLKATNIADAIEEVIGLPSNWKIEAIEKADQMGHTIDEYIHDYVLSGTALGDVDSTDERQISEMTLFEVSNEADLLPSLKDKLSEIKKWQKELRALDQEINERAQYEKLRKKFEK